MGGILYHATYNEYLPQILCDGLLAQSPNCNWEGLSGNAVYLCCDEDAAADFCEAADSVADDIYYSGISVLTIDAALLDENLLAPDANMPAGSGSFEYCGDIAPAAIVEINQVS